MAKQRADGRGVERQDDDIPRAVIDGGLPPTHPGGEDTVPMTVAEKDRGRIDRALMHLDFMVEELKGLADDKSNLAAVVRQTAAKMRNQLGSNVHQWPPIKTIRGLLETVKGTLA